MSQKLSSAIIIDKPGPGTLKMMKGTKFPSNDLARLSGLLDCSLKRSVMSCDILTRKFINLRGSRPFHSLKASSREFGVGEV